MRTTQPASKPSANEEDTGAVGKTDTSCPMSVVPGKSIGKVNLGMSYSETVNLGYQVTPHSDSPSKYYLMEAIEALFTVKPELLVSDIEAMRTVIKEDGKVHAIIADPAKLPSGCLVFSGKPLSPLDSFDDGRSHFSNCGEVQAGIGASGVACEDGGVRLLGAVDGSLKVMVSTPPNTPPDGGQ